ncbi:hypothetical protein GUJ93_ZPchr0006g40866 [Zizania palustris]|uniref:FAS1 domain-containing protein n=1 Tax=Zizania palustris TaxID=103762 RepID=A0A8J5SM92_ZIZPA|nr:hypothetical protein GUJ93_ZPchr0006g40866 [Zizania palustris]
MAFAGILSDCTCTTVFLFLVLLLGASRLYPVGASHNITAILSTNQDFSEFSAALKSAELTAEIDRRTTITVLAVDNGVMAQLRSRRLSPESATHSLALHVLLDYFDDAKLHSLTAGSALATSLFQATGQAKESSGIVNITVRRGGRVAFSPYGTPEASPAVFYQKSIQESPYDIAVLQISCSRMGATASPASSPRRPGAARTYQKSADGGLTVFCPADKAVAAFTSRFKNLTADAQLALLLYHGVAKHYSENALKTINGEVNTLATDGTKSFDLTIKNHGERGETVVVVVRERGAGDQDNHGRQPHRRVPHRCRATTGGAVQRLGRRRRRRRRAVTIAGYFPYTSTRSRSRSGDKASTFPKEQARANVRTFAGARFAALQIRAITPRAACRRGASSRHRWPLRWCCGESGISAVRESKQ